MSLSRGLADPGSARLDFRTRAFRVGVVKEQDTVHARVRVIFTEFDQLLSYWLPVMMAKTQDDKFYWIPDLGEQVVCLMDENDEAGVVLGAIYSQADNTPVQSADKFHLGFKDGTFIEYDRGVHALTLKFQDSTSIKYDAGVHGLKMTFNDGTAMQYDASMHIFSIAGGAGSSVAIQAPSGMTFRSGGSTVSILPAGVTVSPPLPLTSTVAS